MSAVDYICVTSDDISAGEPRNPARCPLASALKRYYGFDVQVFNDRIEFIVNGIRRVSVISPDIAGRIAHYDQTGEMKSFVMTAGEEGSVQSRDIGNYCNTRADV